jgi:hypothetical protein
MLVNLLLTILIFPKHSLQLLRTKVALGLP